MSFDSQRVYQSTEEKTLIFVFVACFVDKIGMFPCKLFVIATVLQGYENSQLKPGGKNGKTTSVRRLRLSTLYSYS